MRRWIRLVVGHSIINPPLTRWVCGVRRVLGQIEHCEEAMAILNIPILRWGKPYRSLDTDDVVHFITGETLARVSQANTGLLGRDMRLQAPALSQRYADGIRDSGAAVVDGRRPPAVARAGVDSGVWTNASIKPA